MLDDATRRAIAQELDDVYRTRQPIQLLSKRFKEMEIADSYAIQQYFVDKKIAMGAKLVGYKVGLTSKPMQLLAGTSEPDFSAILDDMLIAEGSEIITSAWFKPMVEIEIAFVLKKSLKGPNVTVIDVMLATDFILPAIELVDFRIDIESGLTAIDTVADLAAVGAVILGANPRTLAQVDIRTITGTLLCNGLPLESGVADAVLGNPINSVAWLANKLSEFDVGFEAGQLIMSGSFVRARPVVAGDKILAQYDNGLGAITIDFT